MINLHQDPALSEGYRPSRPLVDPTFRILKDLAQDLSQGEIAFPTFINATLNIRRVLNDPKADAERVARTVSAEPMLATKLMYVANSAALSGGGKPVSDVKSALVRVGYSNVHAIATSVAMGQLLVAKEMQPFLKAAEKVWLHSIDVAAIAFVLARKLTKLNPDEALFAGLVHDVGRFYLLSKAPRYPELVADAAALEAVMQEWHAPIGHAVLGSFGLAEGVLQAVVDHETATYSKSPRTLSEIVVIANLVSKKTGLLQCPEAGVRKVDASGCPEFAACLDASADELVTLVRALRA